MTTPVSDTKLQEWGSILCDKSSPLILRFRALFGLRHAKEDLSVELISKAFQDSSSLLKHELAYCLGQKGNSKAIPYLVDVLNDEKQEVIVRHEAAEALGAIGNDDAVEILTKYEKSPVQEIAETCQLALGRISLIKKEGDFKDNVFNSVDPAPPYAQSSVEEMRSILLDESSPLFKRYRAMFTLRDMISNDIEEGTKISAINAICQGLFCRSSALFRHEIAFVLGQLSHPESVESLVKVLQDNDESSMVRHECAEALGSIATPKCNEVLKDFLKDKERVVKESCVIALDISDYVNSSDLQYVMTPFQ